MFLTKLFRAFRDLSLAKCNGEVVRKLESFLENITNTKLDGMRGGEMGLNLMVVCGLVSALQV